MCPRGIWGLLGRETTQRPYSDCDALMVSSQRSLGVEEEIWASCQHPASSKTLGVLPLCCRSHIPDSAWALSPEP